jgi:ATPase family AAA domain-containing protein 2
LGSFGGGIAGGGAGLLAGDLAAAGTPSNLGRVGDASKSLFFLYTPLLNIFLALADADPLGVNVNVTFDEVGGLDDRKHKFILTIPHLTLPPYRY